MALNTIHKNKRDIVNAYDITQDKYFKCELVDDITSERVKTALGLDLPSTRMTLKVNGHCEALEKDKVRVLNQVFIIQRIGSNFSNQKQFRKRADYEYFNSVSYLFLE